MVGGGSSRKYLRSGGLYLQPMGVATACSLAEASSWFATAVSNLDSVGMLTRRSLSTLVWHAWRSPCLNSLCDSLSVLLDSTSPSYASTLHVPQEPVPPQTAISPTPARTAASSKLLPLSTATSMLPGSKCILHLVLAKSFAIRLNLKMMSP